MFGFSYSFGFLFLLFEAHLVFSSGSLGKGRMSTGKDTPTSPLFEVSRSGGAGGFSSSSESIFFTYEEVTFCSKSLAVVQQFFSERESSQTDLAQDKSR